MGASSNIVHSGKRTCRTKGCGNTGRRYIGDHLVCETCRSRWQRRQDGQCSVRGCTGPVRLGTKRTRRYCRSHEDRYLTNKPKRTEAALAEVAGRITHDNIGSINCWMIDGDIGRPNVKVDGLRWRVVRFLWTVFYGTHHGNLELHHVCGNGWCVNPSHCWPVGRKLNKQIEQHLDTYRGKNFVARFAPITEKFDSWCQHHRLDHGQTNAIDTEQRLHVDPQQVIAGTAPADT